MKRLLPKPTMTKLITLTAVAGLAISTSLAGTSTQMAPQVAPVTANDLGMERYKINFTDDHLWIFNGHCRCHPSRWSTTGFSNLYPGCRFHFDFVEKRSGIRIIDNIHEIMSSTDPLGEQIAPRLRHGSRWHDRCGR